MIRKSEMSKAIITPQVSIIVPTYNERMSLAPLVDRIHRTLANRVTYEVIIVDDNSPDGTAMKAKSLSRRYPVRVIVRKNQRGLASAVLEGFNQAKAPYFAIADADLQHPPEEILRLLEETCKGADIAIASRYISGGHIKRWGTWRRAISLGARLLAKMILPAARNLTDPLSGFFLLKREVIDGANLKPTGYKILLEVLAIGHYDRVAEIPYTFVEREKGTTKFNVKEQINYIRHLWSLAWRTGEITRLVKFILVGASGICVNEGVLYLLTEYAGMFYLLSSVFATQSAILNNFTWNHLWTFRDRRTNNESILIRLGKFELVSIGGNLTNILVLYLAVSFLGMHYLAANLIGIAAGFAVNFVGNNIWTWRK